MHFFLPSSLLKHKQDKVKSFVIFHAKVHFTFQTLYLFTYICENFPHLLQTSRDIRIFYDLLILILLLAVNKNHPITFPKLDTIAFLNVFWGDFCL